MEATPDHFERWFNLGVAEQKREKFARAETLYKEVLQRRNAVLGVDHPDTLKTKNNLAGMYVNANAGNPLAWTYAPDYTQQAKFSTTDRDVDGRLTWQATSKQKVGAYYLVAHRFWQDARPNFSP